DCGSASPGPGHDCFAAFGASDAIVGTDAGYFHGSRFGSGCWVYLDHDAGGWHYVDVRCAQAPGSLPRIGMDDTVNVSGCANVRRFPDVERSAHGSDAVLTTLPLAVHCTGQSVHRESQFGAVVRDPDNGRG